MTRTVELKLKATCEHYRTYRHNPVMARHTKWKVLIAGNFSLPGVRKIEKKLKVYTIDTQQPLDEALEKIISNNSTNE